MRKHQLLLFIFILLGGFSFSNLQAQDSGTKNPKGKSTSILDRMEFGGIVGAQFGDVTYIELAPLAAYHITEAFHAGLGLTYQYYHVNYTGYPDYSSSAYGGSIFARYFVWRDLFAHVEYAPLYITNFQFPPYVTPVDEAPWAHDIFLGGGYRQRFAERASVNLMLLFNVNETVYSPYSNPIIRIGFGVGL